ncbi:TVP38/TMEM64 family protein [Clostridium cellulovorans]|uniref:TVP38/TMEM64 family membrane protein n=1 Tax=Clostridium cellulovorans (strain ATCC 35296 / DSM 3052 / OCM 3 / 743B) TaxID=573061 RepID=D9SU94_CLOC7|nr:VTT domain-containing protein [Clostridium cellulovorans]ADL52849.1 SNARE associated Golgi protein [Clostridium cellulovorans 743B]
MNRTKFVLIGKILLALLGGLAVVLIIKYLPYLIEITVSLDKFRDYIVSTGKFGVIMFVSFQILQTIIAPIPGEIIQVAGGYIYGTPLGLLYTILGILLGSIIAFYFTRLIGASFIEKLIKKKKSQLILDIMDSKRFSITLFIFFIIPGLPKDFLIYVAGLTPIKPAKFFGILLISRFPWLLASVSIGANIHYGNYISTIIISFVTLVIFVLVIIYKDKLISKLSQVRQINKSM